MIVAVGVCEGDVALIMAVVLVRLDTEVGLSTKPDPVHCTSSSTRIISRNTITHLCFMTNPILDKSFSIGINYLPACIMALNQIRSK